jgi:hypothetical protein
MSSNLDFKPSDEKAKQLVLVITNWMLTIEAEESWLDWYLGINYYPCQSVWMPNNFCLETLKRERSPIA